MKTPVLIFVIFQCAFAGVALAQENPAALLRVDSITPAAVQFSQDDKRLIFHDEFDRASPKTSDYFAYTTENGIFRWDAGVGMLGGGLRTQFEKGMVDAGSMKVFFGHNPFGKGIRTDETFREIYWRVYVKHEADWEGNPGKLARATCLAGSDWSQGFIAHVWGGKDDCLCIDPATGIRDNVKVSTKYNDFDHLHWLGMKNGKTPIFSAAETGRWVCVESHIKLNTPGKKDGIFELWVDGRLEAAHYELDWHGTWNEYAIDAVFLENWWNDGSVKKQSRWFDNFVISTQPIGPVVAASPVTINRTRPDEKTPWQVEVSTDPEGKDIVWKSPSLDAVKTSVVVDGAHGKFTGSMEGLVALEPRVYWVRVGQGSAAAWSPWHAPFAYKK